VTGHRPGVGTGARADAVRSPVRVLRLPGIVLGIGLGGFVDGILMHQMLQWHHMLTSTDTDNIGVDYYPPTTVHGLEMNTLWDGVFHTFTWLTVLWGIWLLYNRAAMAGAGTRLWTSRVLWGWITAGWGIFNLVEGLVDHHILGIHHVRSGPDQLAWDLGFLGLGAVLLLGGVVLARSGRDRAASGRGSAEPTVEAERWPS
jgi:uncharacterized membrane protein